jgi:hypothetical protein
MKLGLQPSRAEILSDFSQYAEDELPRMLVDAINKDYPRSALDIYELLPGILRKVIEQYSRIDEPEMNTAADEDSRYSNLAHIQPPTPALSLSASVSSSPGTSRSSFSPMAMSTTVPDASPQYIDSKLLAGSVCGSPPHMYDEELPLPLTQPYSTDRNLYSYWGVNNSLTNSASFEPYAIELPGVCSEVAVQHFAPSRDPASRNIRLDSYMGTNELPDLSFANGFAQMVRPLSRCYNNCTDDVCQPTTSR